MRAHRDVVQSILVVIALTIAVVIANSADKDSHSVSQSLQQDDEEFEEYALPEQGVPLPITPLPEEEPQQLPEENKTWVLEITYTSVLVIYAINYLIGRNKNQKIVTAWGNAVQDILTSNFSRFGDHSSFAITKESQHAYSVPCTGRVNCQGAQITLELNKRQDLVSLLMGFVSSPKHDLLTFDVAMEETAAAFVFAIINKKDKQALKDNMDIGKLAILIKFDPLPNYLIYTDSPEVLGSILTADVVNSLKLYESFVRFIYFSDQSTVTPKYKKVLRCVYRLPTTKEEMPQLGALMRMSLHHIDTIAHIKLSAATISKNEKLRAKLLEQVNKQAQQDRQDLMQKKKQEQKRKEAEKFEKLSPEAQRKWEEREYKKQLKERQSRFKVKYG